VSTVTYLRWTLIGILTLHGLIHLMGFAKAFGYAELPQLTQPISRESGVLWLLASVLIVATAVMLGTGARTYWIVGGLALLVPQLVVITAWRDAWAGTAVVERPPRWTNRLLLQRPSAKPFKQPTSTKFPKEELHGSGRILGKYFGYAESRWLA
jgi:hypothetical protein